MIDPEETTMEQLALHVDGPVRDFGDRRAKLWLRPELERWAARLAAEGRTRRKASPAG
jgi:hypothetical protein